MKKFIKLLTIFALTFMGATSAFAADTIVSSKYLDTDHNGTVDHIEWVMDENVTSCSFEAGDWIYNDYGPLGTFHVSAVSCDGSPTLTLTIDGANTNVTGGSSNPVIGYRQANGTADSIVLASGAMTDKTTITVEDGAGPVIISTDSDPAHIQVDEESITDDNVGFFHYTTSEEVNGLSPSGADGFDSWGTNNDEYIEFPVDNTGTDPRPDYENPDDANQDHNYEYAIRLIDYAGNNSFDTYNFHIELQDVNDAPVITSNGGLGSASISIPENTTAVTTVTATDEDQPAQTLTYSLNPGPGAPDTNLFTIDANTGELSFINAPDFENPLDQDTPAPGDQSHDNEYQVGVKVTDDGTGNRYDVQLILVTVTDVSESSHRSGGSKRISKKKLAEIFGKAKKEAKEEVKEETTPACGFVYSRLIKYGTHGEDVKALQTLLNSLGYNTGIADGWYGPKTLKGIKAFQTAMNIRVDGVFGPQSNLSLMQKCSA